MLGKTWKPIEHSPQASATIDDGVTLFATWGDDPGPDGQPFYSAPLSNPTTRTHMTSPKMKGGGKSFAYDPSHHIVYSANGLDGLSRVVTR